MSTFFLQRIGKTTLLWHFTIRRNAACKSVKKQLIQQHYNCNCDIILISMDRDEQAYQYFVHDIPFFCVPFGNKTLRQTLVGKCQITTLPTLGTSLNAC